jgi:cation diffusion facilitator CzcD-associated flavoprotein CzcO
MTLRVSAGREKTLADSENGSPAGEVTPKVTPAEVDVVVIGGGQAALSVGYYLRRSQLTYTILGAQPVPGGAWRRTWPSLRLFSPAQWSSLPGWLMPRSGEEYPSRDDVIAYLTEYERRFALPIVRPLQVESVERVADGRLLVSGTDGVHTLRWRAKAVVSATGSWANPVLPIIPDADIYEGRQLHSADYDGPQRFAGRDVVVVGGGNSGAQITAELSGTANVTWATLEPPVFLPDDVDGRYLFEQATARYKALQEGRTPDPPQSLGHIVAVPTVRGARARGALVHVAMFRRFTRTGVAWPDGTESHADAVIWATGFRPVLGHLAPLGVVDANSRVTVAGTRSVEQPNLWLVGYGEWTGFASATLIGVGRSARATVDEILAAISPPASS